MYDLETRAKVESWRAKAIAGTLTQEDMVQAVLHLTAGRRSAAAASTTAKGTRVAAAKAAKAPLPSGDDLLAEMLGLEP